MTTNPHWSILFLKRGKKLKKHYDVVFNGHSIICLKKLQAMFPAKHSEIENRMKEVYQYNKDKIKSWSKQDAKQQ